MIQSIQLMHNTTSISGSGEVDDTFKGLLVLRVCIKGISHSYPRTPSSSSHHSLSQSTKLERPNPTSREVEFSNGRI